jgi:hypothetical protein
MSHSKEINETSIRQLQITHVELKLYSNACSEPNNMPTLAGGSRIDVKHKYYIYLHINLLVIYII